MTYADVIVVVDGAIQETTTVHLQSSVIAIIDRIADEYRAGEPFTEVYVIWHEHPLLEDCSCVQYLADHRPYATFG